MPRKPLSVRTRFEIFKRDSFTCRYCGRKSPEVILQVDHIVPVAEGGSNDEMNLATSCFDCNSGKSATPLSEMMTGEDPYDRAITMAEKRRQLEEYEEERRKAEDKRKADIEYLASHWRLTDELWKFVKHALRSYSVYDIHEAIDISIAKTEGRSWLTVRYFCGIIRSWKTFGGKEASQKAHEDAEKFRGER